MNDLSFFKLAISIGLLFLQIALVVLTAWVLPMRIKPGKGGVITFIFFSFIGWVFYTILAMFADGYLGNDVPGIGYLVIGFIAGTIGIIVCLIRWFRRT